VPQPKARPPGSRGSMSLRAALQLHVDCRLAESKGFQKAGYEGAMWRFDDTCDLNLTKMLGMEWERDIEAGTSPLHQRALHLCQLHVLRSQQQAREGNLPQRQADPLLQKLRVSR